MTDLTEDEFAVLLIAAQGESMIAIARWEKPIDSLVAKGLMFRHNKHNNTITEAGRQAAAERERRDEMGMVNAFNAVVEAAPTAGARAIAPPAWTGSPEEVADLLAKSLASIARKVVAARRIGEADAARELAHNILTSALVQLGQRP